jgi:hypothetical protein
MSYVPPTGGVWLSLGTDGPADPPDLGLLPPARPEPAQPFRRGSPPGTPDGAIQGRATGPDGAVGLFRVRLHRQRSGELVGAVWTDPATGSFRFGNLPVVQGGFFLVATDPTDPTLTAIVDRVTPS